MTSSRVQGGAYLRIGQGAGSRAPERRQPQLLCLSEQEADGEPTVAVHQERAVDFVDDLVPDYQMGQSSIALFLSSSTTSYTHSTSTMGSESSRELSGYEFSSST